MIRGKFIAVEGIDGSGKTNMCAYLRRHYNRTGAYTNAKVMHFPSPVMQRYMEGKDLTNEEEKLCYLADFAEQTPLINRYLDLGINVIADRWYYSTAAYQFEKADEKTVKQMKKFLGGILRPDLVIIMDISPKTALANIKKREGKVAKTLFLKLYVIRNNYISLFEDCFLGYRGKTVFGDTAFLVDAERGNVSWKALHIDTVKRINEILFPSRK